MDLGHLFRGKKWIGRVWTTYGKMNLYNGWIRFKKGKTDISLMMIAQSLEKKWSNYEIITYISISSIDNSFWAASTCVFSQLTKWNYCDFTYGKGWGLMLNGIPNLTIGKKAKALQSKGWSSGGNGKFFLVFISFTSRLYFSMIE